MATLVTGATGMVGGAVVRHLGSKADLLTPTRKELDLLDESAVLGYFKSKKPDRVLMIAAKVGGIGANMADPVGFLVENLKIEMNLFRACAESGVKKAVFLGSSCMYPRECGQPMREEYLGTGRFEPTNEGYAVAKMAGLQMARSYALLRTSGGGATARFQTVCLIPCNVYGTGDNYDLENSHVLSALIRRFVEAERKGAKSVTLWGTGVAEREFIHCDDVAAGIVFGLEKIGDVGPYNLGTGTSIRIRDLAELIRKEVGYGGEIKWDSSKPDGMPRKCMDVGKLTKLGFTAKVSLAEGVKRTVAEYRAKPWV